MAAKITCNLRKYVTVEPALFLFMVAGGLLWPTMKAVVYMKVCLSNYNASLCDEVDNGNHTIEENVVQSQASHWYLIETICYEVPSIGMSLFYGALSDNVSRKVALLMPMIGQVLSATNYLFCVIFFRSSVGFILMGPLCSGLFGGGVVCNMACYSYISDVTTLKTRTFRMAVVESTISVGIAVSLFFSGILLDKTSFVFVVGLSLSLYTLGVIYIVIGVEEPSHSNHGKRTPKEICTILCSPRRMKDTVCVVFKKRSHGKRKYLLVIFLILVLAHLSTNAKWSLGYLFVKHYPLSWNQTLYGYLVGLEAILRAICILILIPICQKVLGMRETAIMMIGLLSSIISEIVFGFSTVTWMVFIVPFIASLADATQICMRSLSSEQVERQELGQMFAVFGSLQGIGGLVSNTLNNSIYPLTLETWRGICFMVGAGLAIVPLSLMGWMHFSMKGQVHYEKVKDEDSADSIDSDGSDVDLFVKPSKGFAKYLKEAPEEEELPLTTIVPVAEEANGLINDNED